ncbi:hypothetical protein CEXT_152391 [Caerostris extrusa]|uniref:Uncharacterized protein n=1 Tax=Caerostris extrusa TaxID=172846 RepID=A0AAV4WP12_CAEEX|nr:hypothetical protein CEXT_152391 [Caerostris extrusa]
MRFQSGCHAEHRPPPLPAQGDPPADDREHRTPPHAHHPAQQLADNDWDRKPRSRRPTTTFWRMTSTKDDDRVSTIRNRNHPRSGPPNR